MFILKSRYNKLLEEAKEMHSINKALRDKIKSLEDKVDEFNQTVIVCNTAVEFDIKQDDLVSGKQFFCLGFGKRTFISLDGQFTLLNNRTKEPVTIGWVNDLHKVLSYMKDNAYRNIKE